MSPDLAPCLLDISLVGEVAAVTAGAASIAILALDGAGVDSIEAIRGQLKRRSTERDTLTCYGVDALEPIAPSLKGGLAEALPSLHRAGAAAAPIVHREGCPPPPGPAGGATH